MAYVILHMSFSEKEIVEVINGKTGNGIKAFTFKTINEANAFLTGAKVMQELLTPPAVEVKTKHGNPFEINEDNVQYITQKEK